jgi:hypothetical protein
MMDGHEGWMSRYFDILPSIASVFNQIIFLEMIYTAITSKGKHEKEE